MALRGVEFDWNEGNRKGQKDLGLIAQEVEKVLPEIVREKKMAFIDNETYKTIDYDKVVGLLIEAIKEQQEQINKLEDKLNG
jgi:regulator of sigma D